MEQRRSWILESAFVLSALFHLAGIIILSRSRPPVESSLDLQEVSFMDVTYRPEVAKVIAPKSAPVVGGGGETGASDITPTYASGVAAEEVAPLDMTTTLERSSSQARIELDRYELARGGDMDVIRIGGKGSAQTTDEILTQAPISLTRGVGGGGEMELRGVPGVPQPQVQPQLSIEHRPLSKPSGATVLPQAAPSSQITVQAPITKGTSFQIAGPISQREIVRKVKPRYPKWALQQRITGTTTVRIWVMPNGKVKGVPQVICSSGYPDLDQVVVDAVREWEFAPLGAGVKMEDQWGDITFVFQLS